MAGNIICLSIFNSKRSERIYPMYRYNGAADFMGVDTNVHIYDRDPECIACQDTKRKRVTVPRDLSVEQVRCWVLVFCDGRLIMQRNRKQKLDLAHCGLISSCSVREGFRPRRGGI